MNRNKETRSTPAPARAPLVLRFAAAAPDHGRLLRGRLFFGRALVIEGDTEMGLMLKNTPDAVWAAHDLHQTGSTGVY